MNYRHKIDIDYNNHPKHKMRWRKTLDVIKHIDIKGPVLELGGESGFTKLFVFYRN